MHARTRRQQEVLDIIDRHIATNGYRPSYQKIASLLRLRSRAGVARIVQDLEEQGLLSRMRENGHFSIELKSTSDGVTVPWIENDGSEDARPEWARQPLVLPNFIVGDYRGPDLRAFRVTDAAMSPTVEENDISIIETRDYCRDGQLILAESAAGKLLLRTYFRHGSEIELRPENEVFETTVLPSARVRILGVQRGLIRPAQ